MLQSNLFNKRSLSERVKGFLAHGTIRVIKRFAVCLTAQPSKTTLQRQKTFQYLLSLRIYKYQQKTDEKIHAFHIIGIDHKRH